MTARVAFLVWLLASVLGTPALSASPNVLFIAIDDLNNWVLGRHPGVSTPNLDRLKQRGTVFTNAHCAAPACNPSRAAVMTGVAPSVSGVYFNRQDWRENPHLRQVSTLPERFQKAGYKTFGGGKLYHAHTLNAGAYEGFLDPGPWDEYFPSKQRQMPLEVDPPKVPENGNPRFYRGHFDWSALEIDDEAMADAKVVRWAEGMLASEPDQPVFLAVGIYRPHVPWYTPSHWFEQYPKESVSLPNTKRDDLADVPEAGQAMARRAWHRWMVEQGKWRDAVQAYLASLSFADAMVGRLLDALDAGPWAENTIVVLWSDHGYHLGHKEHWEKFTLWEQATQVPLILAGPGLPKGQTSSVPASLLDLYPTLVELCGMPGMAALAGTSLVPWIRNPAAESDRMVVTTHGPGNHGVRSQHWRYIRYADGSEELYDHREDPDEFRNLAGDARWAEVIRAHAAALPKADAPASP